MTALLDQPTIIEAGPVRVDTATRFVTVNQHPIAELTRKEYAVFIALIRIGVHGCATKRSLVEKAWPGAYDRYAGDRRLDATCCRLRAKLNAGMPAGVSLVQSVHGVGYRLVPREWEAT